MMIFWMTQDFSVCRQMRCEYLATEYHWSRIEKQTTFQPQICLATVKAYYWLYAFTISETQGLKLVLKEHRVRSGYRIINAHAWELSWESVDLLGSKKKNKSHPESSRNLWLVRKIQVQWTYVHYWVRWVDNMAPSGWPSSVDVEDWKFLRENEANDDS